MQILYSLINAKASSDPTRDTLCPGGRSHAMTHDTPPLFRSAGKEFGGGVGLPFLNIKNYTFCVLVAFQTFEVFLFIRMELATML